MNVETKSWKASAAVDGEGRESIGAGRVIIEAVTPELDGGRHPIKVVVGAGVVVTADRVPPTATRRSAATCYGAR